MQRLSAAASGSDGSQIGGGLKQPGNKGGLSQDGAVADTMNLPLLIIANASKPAGILRAVWKRPKLSSSRNRLFTRWWSFSILY